jgi:hypothetical protein
MIDVWQTVRRQNIRGRRWAMIIALRCKIYKLGCAAAAVGEGSLAKRDVYHRVIETAVNLSLRRNAQLSLFDGNETREALLS